MNCRKGFVMTVNELYKQAQALSPEERVELANLLIDSVESLSEWTDEELAELLKIEPMTGAEIVASGLMDAWESDDLPDGGIWRESQQKKRQERRKW
jgi:hypothetical protein